MSVPTVQPSVHGGVCPTRGKGQQLWKCQPIDFAGLRRQAPEPWQSFDRTSRRSYNFGNRLHRSDMVQHEHIPHALSRRQFLRQAALAGLAGPALLLACAEADDSPATTSPQADSATTAAAVGGTIGFSLGTLAQRRWQIDRRFVEERATELGFDVVVQAAEDDERLQVSQAENLIAQGVDALILSPVNVETAAPAVTTAKGAGIPVVSYNSLVLGADVDYWVARDNGSVGRLQAELAVAATPTGNYLIISGEGGVDVAQEKTAGNLEVLQPLIDAGDIDLVSQEYHRAWDPALGLAQVENALSSTDNEIAAILCNYDGFVLSALEALREVGLVGETYLAGEDVFEEVAVGIVAGDVAMSVYTDLQEMATRAVDAAVALASGNPVESNDAIDNGFAMIPGSRIGTIAVTADNMREFLEDTGWLDIEAVFG